MMETQLDKVISAEETQCVNHGWHELVVGIRHTDRREVIELRTYNAGKLIDKVTENYDRRIRQHDVERIFEELRIAKMEQWIEALRHA